MEREKNIFDKIGSLIPGYRGYADRDGRRRCDKLLRNRVVEQIHKCESIIDDRQTREIREKNLDALTDLEQCRKRLNSLSSKVQFAPYGESGFFGDSQINEEELSEIYQHDLDLLQQTDLLIELIENTPVEDILQFVERLYAILAARSDYIAECR